MSSDPAIRRSNRERLIAGIPMDWRAALQDDLAGDSFGLLADRLVEQWSRPDTTIYPPEPQVFRALELTPLQDVRAVILGQDPYHGDGEAEGLAFSVPPGKPIPPSLRNIFAEWDIDVGGERPMGGSLAPWARHGVLLLNTVLTVERDVADSHRRLGWQNLAAAIVKAVSAEPRPIAFLVWGVSAQRLSVEVASTHIKLESSHPSPLSANRGAQPFIGSRPFSTANVRLKTAGGPSIDWSLDDLR